MKSCIKNLLNFYSSFYQCQSLLSFKILTKNILSSLLCKNNIIIFCNSSQILCHVILYHIIKGTLWEDSQRKGSKILLNLLYSSAQQQQKSSSKNIRLHSMQNHQILQYYPSDYTTAAFSYFYYPPIIIIDPSDYLFPSQIIDKTFPVQTNTIICPLKPQREHSPSTINQKNKEKAETQDSQHGKSQERNIQKSNQEKIQYIMVSNRNILPNNLNLLLSYIRRINKSGKIVTRIIQQLTHDQNYTFKKFYSYQAYIKEKIPFHKTKQTLQEITEYNDSNQQIFSREEQLFYNKVCRILLKHFLKGDYIITLLNSSKIHKTSKKQHLKIRRYLQLKLQKCRGEAIDCYRLIEG